VKRFTFSAQLDSKGRITIPARIRDKLNLVEGDRISVSLDSMKVIRRNVSSKSEALEFLLELESVQSFDFDGEVLEVVLCE
jgi:AbrB family looped-hinge helix DNA binding protein